MEYMWDTSNVHPLDILDSIKDLEGEESENYQKHLNGFIGWLKENANKPVDNTVNPGRTKPFLPGVGHFRFGAKEQALHEMEAAYWNEHRKEQDMFRREQ